MQAEDFENSVRGAFRRVYSADTSPNEFVSARLGDLWEYVYLAGTEYTNVAAQAKFDSGCGWPAFYEGVEGAIQEVPDADGMRVEIVCSNCKGQSVTPTASLCQLNFQPLSI